MIAPDDLTAMQAVASDRWRTHGPYVSQHVGDLAWGASGPGAEARTALLVDGGYAFRDGGDWWLGGSDDAQRALVSYARDAGAAVWTLEREQAKVAALRAAGYRPSYDGFWHFAYDLTRDLPPFPSGVTSGAADPARRVALHRAAWAPSAFTAEVYDAVRATPPYRADLDVVVEGRAYALAWLDERSASGELEPVGTDPAHRGRGYGARACVAALHRLRAAGARTAVVYGATDPANPGPARLYASVGFVAVDRHVRYLPPTRQNAPGPGGTTP
ncbi:MAG TPA: GNAT family N-acetyltransferase [Frankiaceae bacterium]|nr:GNAT family N-acetyltransferase [Frankiaceae bacterium]